MNKKLKKLFQKFKRRRVNESNEIAVVRASEYFDESWYLQRYEDVRLAGMDAATHYYKFGWREGRNPGPDFDTVAYLNSNKSLEEKGICPLIHLSEEGRNSGVSPQFTQLTTPRSRESRRKLLEEQCELIAKSAYFHEEWYKETYGVSENAVAHYCENDEKCNPSPLFDSAAYMAEYPDVQKVKMNTLFHYEKYGKHEGRYAFPVEPEDVKEKIRECLKAGNMKGLKVLYVSGTARVEQPILDASTRYRCYHPAEALRDAGAEVFVISSQKLQKYPIPYDFDIYVFHRPNSGLQKIISSLKARKKVLIAEYDDLVFGGEEEALNSSIYKNKVRPKEYCINLFKANAQALRFFEYVSVSTEDLASRVMRAHSGAKVQVLHNFIPRSILTLTKGLREVKKDPNQIIYCCGTLSHNKDFQVVNHELVDCLKQNENLRLILMGPLTVEGELLTMPNVFFRPHVDYWDLFKLMSSSALAIAPLEMSMFNDCKSNVKFLEACVAGTYLLATPIPDMKRVGDSDICLCETAEDFRSAIEKRHELKQDEISERNYAYLKKNCSNDTFMEEFAKLLDIIAL